MCAKHRHQPSRLPPPVLSRRKKKRSAKPQKPKWHRHLPWLIPLAACVVFAVLIGGSLAVRQVVIVLREQSPGENGGVESSGASVTGHGGHATVGSDLESATTADAELLASSEPDYEVLPPKAAKEPGRKLRKMLLVGTHPQMFPTLAAALEVAIPGDIIEIRSNEPLRVPGDKAQWEGEEGELTIRGGHGFHPVLVRTEVPRAADCSMLTVKFTGGDGSGRLVIQNLTLLNLAPGNRSACFAVRLSAPKGFPSMLEVGRCVFVTNSKTLSIPADSGRCVVENCYFRGYPRQSRFLSVAYGDVLARNNLFVRVGGGWVPFTCTRNCRLQLSHNTFVTCGSLAIDGDGVQIERRDNIFAHQRSAVCQNHMTEKKNLDLLHSAATIQGMNNIYFDVNFTVTSTPIPGDAGFAGWQALTRNGEKQPLMLDPGFANPQLVMNVTSTLLTVDAFGLSANSPAKGRATDGGDIGADLSQIPSPPPGVEQLIPQLLQAAE